VNFLTRPSPRFAKQVDQLPLETFDKLKKQLQFLAENPRHPSLQTHEVHGRIGKFGGKIFEAYVDMKYRFTWEYGPEKGEITLRNVDNHDDCLKRP